MAADWTIKSNRSPQETQKLARNSIYGLSVAQGRVTSEGVCLELDAWHTSGPVSPPPVQACLSHTFIFHFAPSFLHSFLHVSKPCWLSSLLELQVHSCLETPEVARGASRPVVMNLPRLAEAWSPRSSSPAVPLCQPRLSAGTHTAMFRPFLPQQ